MLRRYLDHLDQAWFDVKIKEDPPVTDTSAKGGALVLETLDIAGERILLHLLEGNAKAFPLLLRRARDGCLRVPGDEDAPGRRRRAH